MKILKQCNNLETDVINHLFITTHDISSGQDEYYNWFTQFGIAFTRDHGQDHQLSLFFNDQESSDNFFIMIYEHAKSIPKDYFLPYPDDVIESEYQRVYDGIMNGTYRYAYVCCQPTIKRGQLAERGRRDTVEYQTYPIYPIDTNIGPEPENEYYAG